jgi:hypothetical protein
MQSFSGKWAPIVVSALVIVIFGFALALLAFRLVPDATSMHDVLVALLAQVQAVISYWLGSSAGSKSKDAIIAQSPPVDLSKQ